MVGDGRKLRLGRQPLPSQKRGQTLSCYIPRWAVERLEELAAAERLTRNKLVGRILVDYVATSSGPVRDAAGRGDRPSPGGSGGRAADPARMPTHHDLRSGPEGAE